MDCFRWQDGERSIRFGRGSSERAVDDLPPGFLLLTTLRARNDLPALVEAADAVRDVGPGLVDELAGELLVELGSGRWPVVCALGGGRVIDVAKAVAAGHGVDCAAVPTTLSAAEMTAIGRQATVIDPSTPRRRPKWVVNDPALSASQPEDELAASAANSLAHAVEGALTTLASPVPTAAAAQAVGLTARAWGEDEVDRDGLALASLLSGYAIDASWYGLSHVLTQTLVRLGGTGHGPANAAVLPATVAALRQRNPQGMARLDATAGRPLEELARELARRAGADGIRRLGVSEEQLDRCADAAAGRAELDLTPPRASRDELRAIYAAAW